MHQVKTKRGNRVFNLRNPKFASGGRALSSASKMRKTDDATMRFSEYRCGFGEGTIIQKVGKNSGEDWFRPRQKGDKISMDHFTSKAKKKIRICAKDLDYQHKELGAHLPHFATLTLPRGNDGESIANYAWRRFARMVERKYLPLQDEEFQYIKVSEVQPERLKKRGERVIHFHIIWNYPINKTELMRMWKHALNLAYKHEGTTYRTPHYVRVDNQPVQASAEKYITKYLTKFSDELSIQGNNYSISRNLLAHAKPTRKHELTGLYTEFLACLSETLYELRDKKDLNVVAIEDEVKGEMIYLSTNSYSTMKDFLYTLSDKLTEVADQTTERSERGSRPKGGGSD